MKKQKKRYDVISPDGFSIHRTDTYPNRRLAWSALQEWKKGYENQGYYSSNRGRIPLDELAGHCTILEIIL